ncbi:MAG: GAF domain-containing protein [Nanoarchaeota archaeon]|nr:GAF domain-containing protein [Nanoarchaeota archaeon]
MEQREYIDLNAVLKAKQELQAMFDSMTDPLFFINDKYEIVRANKALLDTVKKKDFSEIVGRKCHTLVQNRKQVCKECIAKKVFETGEVQTFVYPTEGVNKKYIESSCYPIKDGDKIPFVVCHDKDVTKRRILELRAEKQNQRLLLMQEIGASMHSVLELNVLLKQILDGIVRLGYDYATIYLINEDENLLEGVISTGLEQEGIRNIRIPIKKNNGIIANTIRAKKAIFLEKIDNPNNKIFIDEELFTVSKGHSFLSLPLIISDKVIGILTVDNKNKPLVLSKNARNILGLFADNAALAINRAILYDRLNTFNKSLKEKIKAATIELRAKNIRFKEADKMKSEMLSIVSHELRTPLTSIKGYASLLISGKFGELSKTQKECLEIVHSESERLKDTINSVLNLSKLVSGKERLNLEKTDLNKIISQGIMDLEKQSKEKNIMIYFTPEKELTINIDPEKIRQAINILISNAIKFNKKNGSITVLVNDNPYFLQISVRDTGIGIPREFINKIFDKFAQLEEHMTRAGTGTGIGLSIFKEIIDLHGGDIWVQSTPGKSSTFSFTLPKDIKVKKQSSEESEYFKTLQELETVRTIFNMIHAEFELNQILGLILESIKSTIGFDRIRLYLLDKKKTTLNGVVAIGTSNFDKLSIEAEKDKILQEIFVRKRAQVYHFYDNPGVNKLLGKDSSTPFAAVPLVVRNSVIGLLTADNIYSNKMITRSNLDTFTTFANSTAVAIENATLINQMEKEVEDRTEELTNANERLREIDKQRNEFMGYVSHELRTPLTSLIGYSKLILSGGVKGKQLEESVKIIHKEALRLKNMLDDYLDLTKMEAGKVQMKQKPTDLYFLVDNVIQIMLPQAKQKNLIMILTGQKVKDINIDQDKIKQALLNLISNAIKFTQKGKVAINLKDFDDHVEIHIKDTGIGIAKEDFDKVFDKFNQIQHDFHTEKGSGLGIPITKQIVESHGGKIWFDSQLGIGSTFSFSLPKK